MDLPPMGPSSGLGIVGGCPIPLCRRDLVKSGCSWVDRRMSSLKVGSANAYGRLWTYPFGKVTVELGPAAFMVGTGGGGGSIIGFTVSRPSRGAPAYGPIFPGDFLFGGAACADIPLIPIELKT